MNKFDAKVNLILNEFVGNLIKGAGEGVAAFNAAAKDPTKFYDPFKNSNANKDDKNNQYAYSQTNKPNVNDVAVWSKNPQYKAKVVKGLDQNGNYGIAPVGPNNTPANYVFVRTVDAPNKWKPVATNEINLNYMTYRNVAIVQENKIPQICPKQKVGTQMLGVDYILVGNTKTDIDGWINQNVYNNSQAEQQAGQTQEVKASTTEPRKPRSPRKDRIGEFLKTQKGFLGTQEDFLGRQEGFFGKTKKMNPNPSTPKTPRVPRSPRRDANKTTT